MPSNSDSIEILPAITALAQRYRRFDRVLSIALAAVAVIAIVAIVVSLPLLPAVLVLILLLALLRVPIFTIRGTIKLVADEDPETVRHDFESTTPPVLAFQWAIADDIRSTPSGTAYDFSYLFGRRSITMTTAIDSDPDQNVIELVSQSGGRGWGTYTVSIADDDGTTTVDIELESTRRFELVRLTQLVAAARYQEEMLDAQGYSVVHRNRSVSIWPN